MGLRRLGGEGIPRGKPCIGTRRENAVRMPPTRGLLLLYQTYAVDQFGPTALRLSAGPTQWSDGARPLRPDDLI